MAKNETEKPVSNPTNRRTTRHGNVIEDGTTPVPGIKPLTGTK